MKEIQHQINLTHKPFHSPLAGLKGSQTLGINKVFQLPHCTHAPWVSKRLKMCFDNVSKLVLRVFNAVRSNSDLLYERRGSNTISRNPTLYREIQHHINPSHKD